MRWLHTSDWHLGRGFHGHSLQTAQQEMLQTVCRTVSQEKVDVLLIAGDVYDRALPPEWAVRELESCLEELVAGGTRVIITSGNHDSAQRLGFGRGLMGAAGVHLRTSLEDAFTPVEVPDAGPEASAEERGSAPLTLVYGVPYLEPALVREELGLDRADHTSVMTEVVRRIWEDVSARRRELGEQRSIRTVLMAHLFAARGVGSDSERNIGVEALAGEQMDHQEHTAGGLAVVPLELFDGFDYVALGHLHGRQKLSPTVRYSGSPLRYSFSETDQAKGAWLGDFQDWEQIHPVDWSIGRPLAQLKGGIEEVLDPQTVEKHQEAYLQVTLTDPFRPERAYQRVREAYPQLCSFTHSGDGGSQTLRTYSSAVEEAVSEAEIVTGFLEHVRGRGPGEQEQQLLQEALEAVRRSGAEA
ncbi:exonuclease SbcCD subunit D [Nesterenkonia cremea]|uniref:Nuclease SbcCD subunit D n=1 Tax=Nesterenkonia cremea TaxID=1882340 RepID=A0A917AQD5_9MICC|nr:exonuclease SbcCD subunit D [Nesterenkonia cremea]GGE67886.1 nuclease SbcCD subunit D [Nesterenkonia cremea]